jgi:spermidine synthase
MKIRSASVYLFTIGFFSILGQVVLLRELNVAFYGIELIYILSFAFWLMGTGIGAAIGRRAYIPEEITILMLFLLSSVLLIVDIVFIRGIRNIFGGVPGGYLPFLIQITGLIVALIPIGLLAGLLFQWTAKRFIGSGDTLAKAYAIESAGGIIGAFGSTVFLNFGISNFSAAVICSLFFVLIAIYYSFRSQNKILKSLSLVTAAAFIIILAHSNQIDLLMTSWDHPYLIESSDTPYNRVTITSPEKQICVFEDDVLSYESESVAAEEFVQMSALQTAHLTNVLVLGGGYAGIIDEILKLPVKRIDYVEINRDLINVVNRHLPEGLSNALKNNIVSIIYSDPRKFLQMPHSYDMILVGMPEPMSALTNRFYTEEFFRQCANSLDKKGILAFKMQSSENIWTDQLTQRNTGIYNAVKSSFRNEIVLPGVVNIFIASNSELTTNTGLLISRFNERKLQTRLISPQYINYVYTNDRFGEIKNLLSDASHNINSDFHPVCYSYTISIWLSKFFPGLAFSENILTPTDKPRETILVLIIIILVTGLLLFIRKSSSAKRFILVFAAGFIGMILETILILLYQNTNGILFRDIGLLIMAFMAGLALGSYLINRLYIIMKKIDVIKKWTGDLLFMGFAIIILIVYLLLRADLMNGLLIISISLLIDGIFVSGIFAFVSLYRVTDQQAVVTKLYTADLIGGCIGSLAASLILIPVYGFFFSLIILTGLSVYCSIYSILKL